VEKSEESEGKLDLEERTFRFALDFRQCVPCVAGPGHNERTSNESAKTTLRSLYREADELVRIFAAILRSSK
jgi:hypothetical protein